MCGAYIGASWLKMVNHAVLLAQGALAIPGHSASGSLAGYEEGSRDLMEVADVAAKRTTAE